MSEFKVSSDVSKVEVYVHNRYEHFKRTIARMSISKQVHTTVNQVKKNLESRVTVYLQLVMTEELKYLGSIGINSKADYYKEFSKYKQSGTNEIYKLFYNFTDMSASKYTELEKIYERRFKEEVNLHGGTGVKERRKQALARIQKDIIEQNEKFMTASDEYLRNLLVEYLNLESDGDQASTEALNKRISAMRTTWGQMTNSTEEPPTTLAKAVKRAAQLRKGTGGLGVAFEPVAGMALSAFNDFLSNKFNAKALSGKKRIAGDSDRDNQYTTDINVQIGEINVGIDIKSQSAIYLKSIQRQAYANEVLAAMFLGEGGFSELQAFDNTTGISLGGLVKGGEAELFKKLTYILSNSSVFAQDGGKLKQVDEAEQALRSILIIGGFVDFIVTYLSKAINNSRSQILLFTGEKLIFTSDFIMRLVDMVKKINTENMRSLYGMNIAIEDNKQSEIAEGIKTKLLKQKLQLIRTGTDTYQALFANPELRRSMQTITSKALQRTMTINIKAPLSTLFSGIGQ